MHNFDSVNNESHVKIDCIVTIVSILSAFQPSISHVKILPNYLRELPPLKKVSEKKFGKGEGSPARF